MTAFFKVSASGNDFIALVEPPHDPAPERIRAWCRRGISLGADGVFVLRRGGREGDGGGGGEIAMSYWNADGLPADLCLNGTRCAAQLAFHLDWAPSAAALVIRTPTGRFAARRPSAHSIALDLDLEMSDPRQLTLEAAGGVWSGYALTVGVPHFVLPWSGDLGELETAPLIELGGALRHHAAFQPAGTNVNLVRFAGAGRPFAVRTYERGVEAETLSCGTGVVAAARAGADLGLAAYPAVARTRGGFELTVDQDAASGRLSLTGEARIVAAGELWPGAAA